MTVVLWGEHGLRPLIRYSCDDDCFFYMCGKNRNMDAVEILALLDWFDAHPEAREQLRAMSDKYETALGKCRDWAKYRGVVTVETEDGLAIHDPLPQPIIRETGP